MSRHRSDTAGRPSRARSKRRAFGISAYVGANGGGKSLAMVYDTLPSLAAGRPVLSTVRLLDPATGEPHPLYTPLDDFRTLLDWERGDVLLDEVTGVASSRESMGMPAVVANHLVQLRRKDVVMRWTAPSWKRADVIIRECSQAVTLCMGYLPERVHLDGEEAERMWGARRLFFWRTYDASTFDEWSTYRRERAKPVARQLYRRSARSVAQRGYDTFDGVLSLGEVTDAGTCVDCGGNRPKPKCACARPPKPVRVEIPETDDTPALVAELPARVGPALDPALGVTS